jgi:SAM-dependent methyltransferase
MYQKFRSFIKSITPDPLWNLASKIKTKYLAVKYLMGLRPLVKAETSKARERRLREGFFEKYCVGKGLDIGFGGDLILPDARGWDFEHGDAQYLKGVKNNSFDYVYSSHTLEHVFDVETTLRNWWRILKPGGHLILYIPHRDLYEKKKELPSIFNPTHQRFFLIEQDEPPHTVGIVPLLKKTLSGYEIIYAKECSEGHTVTDPLLHSDGEYSIEVVVKKQ